ncbi:MAG TPA: ATP-binding protein [Rickettsia endosymbiont of Pyrocoelia pectoralis]|nr:ATP-binding protein [Rickettsia endosymbiont of Pyrocoelia pectoralis]
MFGDDFRTTKILKYLILNAVEHTNAENEIIVSINMFDKARQVTGYDKPKELVLQIIVKSSSQYLTNGEQKIIYNSNKNSVSIFEDLQLGMDINVAIVKQLINQLEGELDVRSNEKEGTVFVCLLLLTLPLIDTVVDEII